MHLQGAGILILIFSWVKWFLVSYGWFSHAAINLYSYSGAQLFGFVFLFFFLRFLNKIGFLLSKRFCFSNYLDFCVLLSFFIFMYPTAAVSATFPVTQPFPLRNFSNSAKHLSCC